jgi:hypothetical protein
MIIPPPTYNEPEQIEIPKTDSARNHYIRWHMDCKPWMCSCGIKNFGRNKKCADTKCPVVRPTSYVENVYEPPTDGESY